MSKNNEIIVTEENLEKMLLIAKRIRSRVHYDKYAKGQTTQLINLLSRYVDE